MEMKSKMLTYIFLFPNTVYIFFERIKLLSDPPAQNFLPPSKRKRNCWRVSRRSGPMQGDYLRFDLEIDFKTSIFGATKS